MAENDNPVICTGTINTSGSRTYVPAPTTCVICGKKYDQLVGSIDGKLPILSDLWYQNSKCRECKDDEWRRGRWKRVREDWSRRIRIAAEALVGRHDCED